jgi:hypothetical protein
MTTEHELRELAYQHRGEVVEGSGVAVEPRVLPTAPNVDVDAIRARADAATAGPWFAGYSGIYSAPLAPTYDQWLEPILDSDHTLERRGHCPACNRVGCALFEEDYQHRDPRVASVPPHHGDTPTGRRVADGKFIAAARSDVPALLDALADQQRQTREMADWAGVNVRKVRAVRAACAELRREPFDPAASLDVGEVLRIFEEAIGDRADRTR